LKNVKSVLLDLAIVAGAYGTRPGDPNGTWRQILQNLQSSVKL